jgi:hypothetical protein
VATQAALGILLKRRGLYVGLLPLLLVAGQLEVAGGGRSISGNGAGPTFARTRGRLTDHHFCKANACHNFER